MAPWQTAAAAASKVAVFALLYFVCVRQASLPQDQHLSYSASEAADPHEQFVLRSMKFARRSFDAMGAVALLMYLLPPFKWWAWLYHSGLYDSRKQLQPWTVTDVLSAIVCAAGYKLRLAAFEALGRHFTYVVTILEDHVLVTAGPYRYLMHPSYTAILMVQMGFVVYSGYRRWWMLVPMLSGAVFVLLTRIGGEESALRAEFGQQFDDFAAVRWRLIPFVY